MPLDKLGALDLFDLMENIEHVGCEILPLFGRYSDTDAQTMETEK